MTKERLNGIPDWGWLLIVVYAFVAWCFGAIVTGCWLFGPPESFGEESVYRHLGEAQKWIAWGWMAWTAVLITLVRTLYCKPEEEG